MMKGWLCNHYEGIWTEELENMEYEDLFQML